MVVSDKKWEEIFNAAAKSNRNSTGSDVFEQIKANLKKEDKGAYQEWAQKGFDIDHMFMREYDSLSTLLCIAAGSGHKDIVEILLDEGAVDNVHEDIVRILLDKGAIVDEEDNLKMTPLQWAVTSGYERASKFLYWTFASGRIPKSCIL